MTSIIDLESTFYPDPRSSNWIQRYKALGDGPDPNMGYFMIGLMAVVGIGYVIYEQLFDDGDK